MTKGAFYNAFKSKENFLLQGLLIYGEMTVTRLTSQISKEHNKALAIDRLYDLYDSMFDAQPKNNFMGCMVNNVMSELGANNPIVGSAAANEFNSFIEAIEPCVKAAQLEGDLPLSIDSKTLTELLHVTFYGALTRAKSTQDHHQGKLMMRTLLNSFKNKQ